MSGPPPTITASDRMLRAWRALVRDEFPRLTFAGVYEFAVQGSDGTTVDVTPTDGTIGLPSTVKVPLRLPISTAKPANGQKVLLTFVNGDPTRPIVFSSDPIPTTLAIDATGTMTLGGSSSAVTLGPSATITMGTASAAINMGPVPTPLVKSVPLATLLTAVNTAFGAISTYANAIQSVANPSMTATNALTAAMGAIATATGTGIAAMPTTVVKGT